MMVPIDSAPFCRSPKPNHPSRSARFVTSRLPLTYEKLAFVRKVPSAERAALAALARPPAAKRSRCSRYASSFSDSGMKVPSKYRHASRARARPPARPRGRGARIAWAKFSMALPMTGAACAAPMISAVRNLSCRSPSISARSAACSASIRWMRSSKSLVRASSAFTA